VSRHPQNGPSLSKAPPKNLARKAAPSPARQEAARAEAERDAAEERRFHKDPGAWVMEQLRKEKK
jgi:hypothetical protein